TAGDQLFQGILTGNVMNKPSGPGEIGGITITWNGPLVFAFSEVVGGQTYSGTATFTMDEFDMDYNNPGHGPTGHITISGLTAPPERASIALFATGLVGMIPVVRYSRRRNRA